MWKLLIKTIKKIFASPVHKIRRYTEYLLTHPATAADHLVLHKLEEPVLYRAEAIAAIQELDIFPPQQSLELICFQHCGQTSYAWATQYLNGQILIILGTGEILFVSHLMFDFQTIDAIDSLQLPLPPSKCYVVIRKKADEDICVESIKDDAGRIRLTYTPQRSPNWIHLCFRAECF